MVQAKSTEMRLQHFTPLRYPGGKGKIAPFIKTLVEENNLLGGEYAEPYAGGAAIALELLLQGHVKRIYINDISRPIYAFWKTVLDQPEALCRLIKNTPISVRSWDKQKKVFVNQNDYDNLELGFSTFFLNRTNRSGILNGGIIGGRGQTGPWKIDARYNSDELIRRVQAIADLRSKIRVTRKDAQVFLETKIKSWAPNTLIYLDPPYYAKGKALYYDYYTHEDHKKIAEFLSKHTHKKSWIISYDNEKAIRKMYAGWKHITYGLGYSARESTQGTEVMFFSDNLNIPPIAGAMRPLKRK